MTMFNRNDKAPDQNPVAKPAGAPSATAPIPMPTPTPTPAPAEPRRVAQPSHGGAASAVSLISKALKITGQLESTEDIQIEGEVDGDVRAVTVKVGHNAKVKGSVYGDEVELSGSVSGKIEARKVVLTSTAHMSGDVIHQDIRIDSGAYIDGHCRPDYGKTDTKVHAVTKPVAQASSGGRAS